MSSPLIQQDLNFDSAGSDCSNFGYCYLVSEPELGPGKILEINQNSFNIFFPSQNRTISADRQSVKTFAFSIDPIFNIEKSPHAMNCALTAYELKFAHLYDKLSSLSNSRTRLLPHQIESTHIVANSIRPRFILADEVGLGKTIEAGLIMKELMFRNGFSRVLVVAPSPLLYQWKQELKSKFNEDFEILKRKNFVTGGEAFWRNFDKAITSIDFIKNPVYSEEILKKKWDIVIFDEAHRLRKDYSKATRAYIFAEKIATKCESLLLLSATPFRGKLEELFYLVHLIDPYLFGPYHTFVNDYILNQKSGLKEKISKIMLRRRKVEIGGFTKRFAKTVRIELSQPERLFYDETTEYVRNEYNLAMNTKNRAVGFIMIVFQKLLDSSVTALQSALKKRKFLLENKLANLQSGRLKLDDWNLEDTEGIEEFLGDLKEDTIPDWKKIKKELLTLNRLILLGKNIKEDRKSQKLKELLLRLKKEGTEKFIIFTQFRTTQDYLTSFLSEFRISVFHGSLSAEEKEKAILAFKENTEILISTEAGGEGRNLQFSNVMINYDLPWSPLKIEQRIGRIHRFGQKKDVYVFNFASKDTVAERILEVLTEKIRLFEESIGASDALLGSIEDELDFQSTFMKFIAGNKSKKELDEEIETKMRIAEQGFQKLNDLVTPRILDFNLNDYYKHSLEERSYSARHLEELTLDARHLAPNSQEIQLTKLSSDIYQLKRDNKTSLGTFNPENALVNENLEFLAFGHPLVDTAISTIFRTGMGKSTIRLNLPSIEKDVLIFVFIVTYHSAYKQHELVYAEYCNTTGRVIVSEERPKILTIDLLSKGESNIPNFANIANGLETIEKVLTEYVKSREKDKETKTGSLYNTELKKLEGSRFKTIRHLEERLSRQEAAYKWENKPEKKSAMNRTKNEIFKTQEEYEKNFQKIIRKSRISHQISLFQVYVIS